MKQIKGFKVRKLDSSIFLMVFLLLTASVAIATEYPGSFIEGDKIIVTVTNQNKKTTTPKNVWLFTAADVTEGGSLVPFITTCQPGRNDNYTFQIPDTEKTGHETLMGFAEINRIVSQTGECEDKQLIVNIEKDRIIVHDRANKQHVQLLKIVESADKDNIPGKRTIHVNVTILPE